MRKKVAIAVGLAAIAVLSLWLWSRSVVNDVGGGQKIWVAVAAEDLVAGARVQRGAIAVRGMPQSYRHPPSVPRGDATEDPTALAAGGPRTFVSITVAVDLEEAELLVFAMQRGPINIALRGADDIETEEQVPDKNFGDIFEAPKRQNFAKRHAA